MFTPFAKMSLTQAELSMQVDGAIDRSKTPRAFKDFPPVPAMTLRQISHERFLFGYISSAHYGTLDFSPASKAIYGEPATYSDFRRLMTAPHNRKVLPKILDFDRLIATSSRFLWFCKLVDDRAAKKNAASVTRREMEAAWACLAVKLWETYMPVSGYKDTELLRKALDARLLPKSRVEQYWMQKAERLGWDLAVVERMGHNCEEPEYDIAGIPENEEMAEADDDGAMAESSVMLDEFEVDSEATDVEDERAYGHLSTAELLREITAQSKLTRLL